MSANGLPSNSSDVATRFMSVIERASRKASRNLLVWPLRMRKLTSLMIRVVQETMEASSRPTITVFTTGVAWMNICTGVILPAPLMVVGASVAPPLLTPPVSALAVVLVVVFAAAAVESSPVFWAKAGALTAISAKAPSTAIRGVVRFVSNIFSQFLVDRANGEERSSRMRLPPFSPVTRPA